MRNGDEAQISSGFLPPGNDAHTIMKNCPKCSEIKLDAEFYKNERMRDGLSSLCKSCIKGNSAKWSAENPEKRRVYHTVWYLKNKDKNKESTAKWRAKNPDKYKANNAKFYADNKEKRREYNAKWREANPEKVKAKVAAWQAANPEARRIIRNNRRASKLDNGGKLSKGLSEKLFKLQRGKCACGCKQPLGDNYHLDHIMPLALGGANVDSNIQLLRQRCNLQKHAKHPVDFMQQRGFLL